MKYIIDRFENDYAVVELENGELIDIPKKALPAGVVSGSIVEVRILEEETNQRRSKMKEKMNSIFR